MHEERIKDEKNISSKSIPVMDNGDDIAIRIKDINPSWEIQGEVPRVSYLNIDLTIVFEKLGCLDNETFLFVYLFIDPL